MRAFKSSLALAGVVALATLPAAAQDLTIVFKGRQGGDPSSKYFTASKTRHNMGAHDSIMDFTTGTIISIDNGKKEYSEVTLDQMEAP